MFGFSPPPTCSSVSLTILKMARIDNEKEIFKEMAKMA